MPRQSKKKVEEAPIESPEPKVTETVAEAAEEVAQPAESKVDVTLEKNTSEENKVTPLGLKSEDVIAAVKSSVSKVISGKWSSFLVSGDEVILDALIKLGIGKGQIVVVEPSPAKAWALTQKGYAVNSMEIKEYRVSKRFSYVLLPNEADAMDFAFHLISGGIAFIFGKFTNEGAQKHFKVKKTIGSSGEFTTLTR